MAIHILVTRRFIKRLKQLDEKDSFLWHAVHYSL